MRVLNVVRRRYRWARMKAGRAIRVDWWTRAARMRSTHPRRRPRRMSAMPKTNIDMASACLMPLNWKR